MTRDEQISFWRESAERDWQTANDLFNLTRYDACLFFCHLALEKALKGLVEQKTNEPAPYVHDLVKLAEAALLSISDERRDDLRTVSTFNIAGRYPDTRFDLYRKATREYTEDMLTRVHTLYLWITEHFQNR